MVCQQCVAEEGARVVVAGKLLLLACTIVIAAAFVVLLAVQIETRNDCTLC